MAGRKGRSGRRREPHNTLKLRLDKLETVELPGIIDNLVTVARGGSVICPHCNRDTGIAIDIDSRACEYLVDRIMGKPKQSTNISVTEKIVLTADQALRILARAELQRQAFDGIKVLELPSPVNEDLTNT